MKNQCFLHITEIVSVIVFGGIWRPIRTSRGADGRVLFGFSFHLTILGDLFDTLSVRLCSGGPVMVPIRHGWAKLHPASGQGQIRLVQKSIHEEFTAGFTSHSQNSRYDHFAAL